LKKVLWAGLGIVALAVVSAVVFLVGFYRDQPWMFSDPVLDTIAPVLPDDPGSPALLVFSKTNGFRHKEGIPAGRKILQAIAAKNGWSVYITENGAVHNPEQLARFSAVVWANTSGTVLTVEQQSALRDYIESGGGFIGIHAAGDGSHKQWDWYQDTILRADFIGHTMFPHLQDAEIEIVARAHPAVAGLPTRWKHHEEWYAFERSPSSRGSTVLLTADESTYDPGSYSMPAEHAMAWAHEVGQGRVVYSALGHNARSFETPEHQQFLEQAIRWVGNL
jgi:type 1 glutamine amidotransferase